MSAGRMPTSAEWTTEDVRKAWHDATCPEGEECREREVHQLSFESMSVVLELFLDYLPDRLAAHDAEIRAQALGDVLEVVSLYMDITSDNPVDWECEPEDRWRLGRDLKALIDRPTIKGIGDKQ